MEILLILLLLGGGGSSAPAVTPVGLSTAIRMYGDILTRRAAQGGSWRADIETALHEMADRLTVRGLTTDDIPYLSDALARWIGIESGGSIGSTSSMGERGLIQMSKGAADAMGLTPDEWAGLADPKRGRSWHARMAVASFLYLASRGAVAFSYRSQSREFVVFEAKLVHSLPLLVKELAAGKVDAMSPSAWRTIKASPKLLSFGTIRNLKAKWPDQIPGARSIKGMDGLILRFWTDCEVVAGGPIVDVA